MGTTIKCLGDGACAVVGVEAHELAALVPLGLSLARHLLEGREGRLGRQLLVPRHQVVPVTPQAGQRGLDPLMPNHAHSRTLGKRLYPATAATTGTGRPASLAACSMAALQATGFMPAPRVHDHVNGASRFLFSLYFYFYYYYYYLALSLAGGGGLYLLHL